MQDSLGTTSIEHPDAERVAGILAGRPADEKWLFEEYFGLILRLARGAFSDKLTAETAAVFSMRHVFLKIDRFRFRSRLKTYVYRVALWQILKYRRRWADRPATISLESLPVEFMSSAPDPAASYEARRRFAAALRLLNRKEQEVVLLRYTDGLSYREIARIQRATVTCVRERMSRARAKMQEGLEGSQHA